MAESNLRMNFACPCCGAKIKWDIRSMPDTSDWTENLTDKERETLSAARSTGLVACFTEVVTSANNGVAPANPEKSFLRNLQTAAVAKAKPLPPYLREQVFQYLGVRDAMCLVSAVAVWIVSGSNNELLAIWPRSAIRPQAIGKAIDRYAEAVELIRTRYGLVPKGSLSLSILSERSPGGFARTLGG